MKKVLVLLMCVMLLLTFVACNSAGFMSASKVKRVVNEFGTPQAQVTISFTKNSRNFEYVIVYNLLLNKAPIAVINFIQLVEEDFYDGVIFDEYNSSYRYFVAGRYAYLPTTDDEGTETYNYYEKNSGRTFAGEFKSNKYSEPEGGYAQFSMFSLAMYHGGTADDFNSADGTLIFSTGATESETSLQYTNYAVFAEMESLTVKIDGNAVGTYRKVNATYLSHFTDSTSKSSHKIIAADNTVKEGISIMSTNFVFSVEMMGDKDWSKLPKVSK
ncbi:MAG: peptidylprolyl isomerase [Firmicutes bacterium]|nr:peptidylprolyl isomerase [Bacillota bacterium]